MVLLQKRFEEQFYVAFSEGMKHNRLLNIFWVSKLLINSQELKFLKTEIGNMHRCIFFLWTVIHVSQEYKESVNCNNPTANMIKTQNGKESSSDYDHQK